MFKRILVIPVILFICFNLLNFKTVNAQSNSESNQIAKIKDVSEEQINQYFVMSLIYPKVELQNNEVAQRNINNSIKEYIDKVKAGAEDIQKLVDKNKNSINRQYYCTTSYVVTLNENNLLSFVIVYNDYTGGANTTEINEPFNFDLTTGKRILIKDLFKEDKLEETINLINKNISTGFENSSNTIFKFESIDENVKFYMADTYLKLYFNAYEYTPYSEGTPTFKMPYTIFSDSLKYEQLKNTNYRYNDGDIVYLLQQKAKEADTMPYILQQYGFDMDKNFPEISMMYTAAKYINDNMYSYYITSDELETFIYHVYGRKLNAYDIIKDSNDKSYEFDLLQCKNGVYKFSSTRPTNYLIPSLEKKATNKNANTDAYGIVNEYSKDGNIKNTYGYKLTFMKSFNSSLGYNILNYNVRLLDYGDMVSEKIESMLNEK